VTILLVNWAWYPTGGDWTAIENLVRLYERQGHTVIPFAMKDPRNLPTPYERYFVDNIDYRTLNSHRSVASSIRVLGRSIYSLASRRSLDELLRDVRVDVAHLHGPGPQITCSILSLLKAHRIPTIWTLHDYWLLCPATSFVRRGEVCERCRGNRFYECTLGRCKKDSYPASLVASLAAYARHMQNVHRYVDRFICPSRMLYDKFVEFGFAESELVHIHNPFDTEALRKPLPHIPSSYGRYILCTGRVEREKGVFTLMQAMGALPGVNLVILGEGTQLDACRNMAARGKAGNVFCPGRVGKEEVYSFIQDSLFVVCPSEVYENMPYSVVEAMLLGKPVVGSRIGGIPEFVLDDVTGLTFAPGNVQDLTEKLMCLLSDQQKRESCGRSAQKYMARLVSFDAHYRRMQEVFRDLKLGEHLTQTAPND